VHVLGRPTRYCAVRLLAIKHSEKAPSLVECSQHPFMTSVESSQRPRHALAVLVTRRTLPRLASASSVARVA
jgi:hypothetical protein